MEVSLDDWELTLKELKSQRLQMLISLHMVEAGIVSVEGQVEVCKLASKGKEDGKVDGSKD